MQINISTRHGHLSPETREKIAEKVKKLPRFYERLTAAEVTVDLEHRETPQVELRISAERREDFVAADRGDSLMKSVDNAIHKLEQQLRKFKEKLKGHRLPGARRPEVSSESEAE